MRINNFFLFFVLILISCSSCVSKKKYERDMDLANSYKNLADIYKGKYIASKQDSFSMAVRIDSLLRDSIEMSDKLRSANMNSTNTPAPQKYRPQTISDERELKLKVIYLYNIANGTEWDSKYKKGNFVIGVLGKSPITTQLQKEFANKKKGAQSFTIVEFESVKAITDCELLFISQGNYKSINAVKAQVKKFSTLLVSEEDFPASAAHFNLAVDGDAIKMNVNRDLINKASFNVSKSFLNSTE